MLYDIALTIRYAYDRPAGASHTLLRILPRPLPHQRLVMGAVTADPPPDHRSDGTDFFGNPVTEMAHRLPLAEVAFTFRGRVERLAPAPGIAPACRLGDLAAEVAAVRDLAPDSPHHFLGASPRVPQDAEIAAFALALAEPAMDAAQAVRAVGRGVHRHFAFDATATDVTTAPLAAFRARRGVCQDISHVTISALRALGIPAAYVSGFLRTEPPEGQPRLEGADAMHAWVRAWCGAAAGWIEIDPTNDMDATTDHVVVAQGRDYADVAPVRGSVRSDGVHSTMHQVDMIPVTESAPYRHQRGSG